MHISVTAMGTDSADSAFRSVTTLQRYAHRCDTNVNI